MPRGKLTRCRLGQADQVGLTGRVVRLAIWPAWLDTPGVFSFLGVAMPASVESDVEIPQKHGMRSSGEGFDPQAADRGGSGSGDLRAVSWS